MIEYDEPCIESDTNCTPIQYSAFEFRREPRGKKPTVFKYFSNYFA